METLSIRDRRYEAVCFLCRDSFSGSEPAAWQWLYATSCSGAQPPGRRHNGVALAVGELAPTQLAFPRQLPCDCPVSARLLDPAGRFHSHSRRRFFWRGQDWSCCLPTSTYAAGKRANVAPCGQRGTRHVVMPRGLVLPLSAEDGRCGIVCDPHSAELKSDGATATRL